MERKIRSLIAHESHRTTSAHRVVPNEERRATPRHVCLSSIDRQMLLWLQRASGNRAAAQLLLDNRATLPLQRQEQDDDEGGDDPSERRRQSRPRNAPPGTRPIDQSGLDRETIHKIKDGIGAGPRDWVGVTPDGQIITTDGDGNAQDEGHVSDYARSGAEDIPKWVWIVIGFAAMIALIVLFVTGVGEVGLILAGAGAFVIFVVRSALRAAGRNTGPVATAKQENREDEEPAAA